MTTEECNVRLGTPAGRGVVLATVLGSGISFLDGLVVNIALPKIDEDIGLGVAGLQWVVSGYLLSLSALLLLGGALGDTFGRRKIYLAGLFVFVLSSVACGLAVNAETMITARIVQGIGGALMVPAGLAIIEAVFVEEDRGRAIGQWTGLSTFFTALGPFVGGVFVTYISWRWAFFINVPLGILAWYATMRYIPESRAPQRDSAAASRSVDFVGGASCALALGALTYWSIEGTGSDSTGWPLAIGLMGCLALIAFVTWEARAPRPMLPLHLFRSTQFNWINLCTIFFYGAFVGGVTLLGVQLQVDLHYDPLIAALATLPVSGLMILLSGRFGAVAQRFGPKLPMTVGQLLVAASLFWMASIEGGRDYLTFVLPAILVWGLGLSMVVAPLTASALAAADRNSIGVASAVNNAASRVGQAFAIALLPALAGMSGGALDGPAFHDGYPKALHIAAAMCAASAIIALLFVSGRARRPVTT